MALKKLDCPAKINLGLVIQGQREDDYHLLNSIVVPIDWFDTLTISNASGLTLRQSGATQSLPATTSNLVIRAAKLIAPFASTANPGASIHLQKNIPIGAGLGGGSSNAAACLKALHRLWNCNLSTPQLEALALKLGADVPFFIRQRPARMQGIGEWLTPVEIPILYLLVLVPSINCNTARVYKAHAKLNPKKTKQPQIDYPTQLTTNKLGVICNAMALLGNDLTQAIFAVYPELSALVTSLPRSASWQFSGSGSALFCLCESFDEARALDRSIPTEVAGLSLISKVVATRGSGSDLG